MAAKMRRVTVRVDPLQRLGELVEAARLSWTDPRTGKPYDLKPFARDVAHISRQAWINIETGATKSRATTYRRVEDVFGWETGSILRYLDDDGPEPGPPLVVSDIGGKPHHTLSVDYEGRELSAEDQAQVEALVRRLARNGD